jgi:hypothetical protein
MKCTGFREKPQAGRSDSVLSRAEIANLHDKKIWWRLLALSLLGWVLSVSGSMPRGLDPNGARSDRNARLTLRRCACSFLDQWPMFEVKDSA